MHLAAKYQMFGKGAGAAFAGAAATVVASRGRETRSQAASIALYNDLMQRDDPGSISTEEVKAIGSRYGVDFSQSQVGDLQQIYSEFLMALIPTDEASLMYVQAADCLWLFKLLSWVHLSLHNPLCSSTAGCKAGSCPELS